MTSKTPTLECIDDKLDSLLATVPSWLQRVEKLEDKVEGILNDETPLCQKLADLESQVIGLDDFEAVWDDFKREQEFQALDAAEEKRLLLARLASLEKAVKLQGNTIAALKLAAGKRARDFAEEEEEEEEQHKGQKKDERLLKKQRITK
jgi:hypothetical protein